MKNFDWETEESDDQLFSDPLADGVADGRKVGRKLLVLFGVLCLIVGVFYWQLARRAEAQTAAFEADVLAAFNVWQQAVAQGDEELFNALLVGAKPGWATGQRSLFHAGLVMNRSQLDLSLAANEDRLSVAEVEVRLSPDWTSAEISFEQVYNLIDHPVDTLSSSRQIRLAQNIAFRRNSDRWFLAEPPDDFWGDMRTEETPLLTVAYPERDEVWALRLAQDLAADLAAVCGSLPSNNCAERETIELRLESENNNPILLRGWEPTLVDGRVFVMPSFSLVGRPVDESGYALLYQFYTRPILDIFRSWVDAPIPLPDQELQLICYQPNGRVPKLMRYSSRGEWTVDIPDSSFRYLSPMTTDEGLILQQYLPGEDSSHLRVVLWKEGQETLVYDDAFSHLMLYPVGWTSPPEEPNLLLHGYAENPTLTTYSHIDLNDCDDKGCRTDRLEGFPIWSPDGRHTILQQHGRLLLGDGDAISREAIGVGLSPFWLDNERYGYLRYLTDSDTEVVRGRMEIVTAEIGDHTPERLLVTDDFLPGVSQRELASSYFSFVTGSPANSYDIFVVLRGYGNQEDEVKIFSVPLSLRAGGVVVEDISLEMILDSGAIGQPSLAAPNGFVPFLVSADGRWLSASRPATGLVDSWLIQVHDTQLNKDYEYVVGYPSWMFLHPYYDWSKDGNWLVIVEQNYLRLVAPAYNYERLIAHDLQSCSHVAWVDGQP